MKYAKIENGQVVEYPFSIKKLLHDNPNMSFPYPVPESILNEFGIVQVISTNPPNYPFGAKVIEVDPLLQEGEWRQAWQIVMLSPEELEVVIAEFQKEVVARTQQRLDEFAQTRNYDDILSAATYATSTVPKFALEGQYAVNARDATWSTLYQILAEVQGGIRPMPESFEEIEPVLPVLAWPE